MCITPCVHFIGFKDEAYYSAINVFGRPHFIHRYYDRRAMTDIAPGDTVVFANSKDWNRFLTNSPSEYSFNDSEQF